MAGCKPSLNVGEWTKGRLEHNRGNDDASDELPRVRVTVKWSHRSHFLTQTCPDTGKKSGCLNFVKVV